MPGLTAAIRRHVVYSGVENRISKKRTNIAAQHGADAKTRNPAEPGARHDAAADAGHQAAAALQSRPGRLCGGRARAQSAAGARRARASGDGRRRGAPRPTERDAAAAETASADWLGRRRWNEPRAPSRTGSAPASTMSFRRRRRAGPRARRRGAAALFRMGGRRRGAAARTATTISKPSSRPRRTLADHLAEQLALAVADPARRMIGQYLIDLVDEAGYLAGDLAAVADKLGAPLARGRSRARRSCRASIRPACARAI